MWPVVTKIFDPTVHINDKLTYINLVTNVHSLKLESEDDTGLVKFIVDKLVNSPISRYEGLMLMYAALQNCPKLIFPNWVEIILGNLKCGDAFFPRKQALRIINHIVIKFGKEDAQKASFRKFVPEVIPILLDSNYQLHEKEHSCYTLSLLMRELTPLTGLHSDEIQIFLLKELSNPCIGVIEAVADCFALLPLNLLYFRKSKSAYMDMWLDVFLKALNTADVLLDEILKFPSGDTLPAKPRKLQVFDVPEPKDEDSGVLTQMTVFASLCRCMARMLSGKACCVQIPLDDLLETCKKVLLVAERIKNTEQESKASFMKLGFPLMLNGVFVVLEAVTNVPVIEHSGNIVHFLNDCLQVMKTLSYSYSSMNQMRSTVWKLVHVWLIAFGSKVAYEIVRDDNLLVEMLKDVSLEMEDAQSQDNNQNGLSDIYRNRVLVCGEALSAIKEMIDIGADFMEQKSLEKIASVVLNIARNLLVHLVAAKMSPFAFPDPYSDEKCRKKLYSVILSVSTCGDTLQTKDIMQALNIFKIAMKDPSSKVSYTCQKALKYAKYYLNPKKPPPDAISCLNLDVANRPPPIESIHVDWENGATWNMNEHSDADQMPEAALSEMEVAYSNPVETDSDILPAEQIEESAVRGNSDYRTSSKHSSQSEVCDEESDYDEVDEEMNSDLVAETESSYVFANPIPHRMASSRINNVGGIQSSLEVDQQVAELRTDECSSEEITNIPTCQNMCENVKQVDQNSGGPILEGSPSVIVPENGTEEFDEEGDVDEEDEEGEDDDGESDDVSDDKHSAEYDEEVISKKQRMILEEESSENDEEIIHNNQQSSEEEEEEETIVNNQHSSDKLMEINNQEDQNDMQNASNGNDRSPTIKEMCGDFVLAEPEEEEEES